MLAGALLAVAACANYDLIEDTPFFFHGDHMATKANRF